MSAYTEADVQLVAQALDAEVWTSDLAAARAVLAALADAGRLTPDGADLPIYVIDDGVSCNDNDCPCDAGYVLPISRRTTAREVASSAARHHTHFQHRVAADGTP